MNNQTHRGWHNRGYLPHFDAPGTIQHLTIQLYDALPVRIWTLLGEVSRTEGDLRAIELAEEYLDHGYGSCYLADPQIARLVENALLHFDGKRYRLHKWVVMPSHVHALVEILSYSLSVIIQSWKTWTSYRINRLLGRSGSLWYLDYFDRRIRNSEHYDNAARYIEENPVKAGLVARPEDWTFSSAARRRR